MSTVAQELRRRIETRTARVGVVGLGYVGLPLAVELATAGFETVGLDLDPRKIAAINAGESYIPDVPTSDVHSLVASGKLRATTDYRTVADLDTVNICVPTPLRKTKDPDMSFVVSAVEAIAEHLHPGMLVILESTTYPGTTEELVQPLLERTGLVAGVDFFLAFSPERVDPGNATFQTRNVPKVVGGTTPECGALAGALYATAIETIVPVSSPRVAEMVKLLENTFRAVNIGLVNEIALMCDRLAIDVWEVVDAAKTKPFGFLPFYPGPGLGGHCIPIDPFYLSWKAKQTGFEARFIELAGQVNGRCGVQARHRRHPRIAVTGRDERARTERHARVVHRPVRSLASRARLAWNERSRVGRDRSCSAGRRRLRGHPHRPQLDRLRVDRRRGAAGRRCAQRDQVAPSARVSTWGPDARCFGSHRRWSQR